LDLEHWWKNKDCEIHHFIGKDIAYFHTLFWPAMLETAGYSLPTKIHVHGFLTVNGEKMSKSKGTFILARTYLEHLPADYLRYYFASKLSRTVQDIDLNFDEFTAKVNSDLVGKVVNLASRTARFVEGKTLCPYPEDGGLFADGANAGIAIAESYEACDYGKALRSIMMLADRANEYVESKTPWVLRKDPEKADELLEVCTVALNLFRQITVYLCPVLPNLAERASSLLGAEPARWTDASTPVAGSVVAPFEHLMQRVDPKRIQAMIEASREAAE
jgi:methionyl-tRNA synthetase